MSKMQEIENIVLKVLQDKKKHAFEDIRERVEQENASLLDNKKYLSVVLNYMKDKKNLIDYVDGMYKMKSEEKKMENNIRIEFLDAWREFYEESELRKELSYDMSEKEFRKGKWVYELNKKVEELINTFTIQDNNSEE